MDAFLAFELRHERRTSHTGDSDELDGSAARRLANIAPPVGCTVEDFILSRSVAMQAALARQRRRGALSRCLYRLYYDSSTHQLYRQLVLASYMLILQTLVKSAVPLSERAQWASKLSGVVLSLPEATQVQATLLRLLAARVCPRDPRLRSEVSPYLAIGCTFSVWSYLVLVSPKGLAGAVKSRTGSPASESKQLDLSQHETDSEPIATAVLQSIHSLFCGTLPIDPVPRQAPIGVWRKQAMLAVGEALSDSNSKAIDSSRFPVLYSDENDHALFPNGLIDSIAATLQGPSQYAEPAEDAMAYVTRRALHSEATTEAVAKGDGRVSRTGIFKPIPRPTMRDALVHLQSVRAAKLKQTEERSAETLSLGLLGEETKLMMDCMQPTQEVLQQELTQLNRAASERPSLEEMRFARLERGCDRTEDVLKYRDAARSGTARRGGGSSIRKVSTRLVGSPLAVASMRAWSLQGSGLRGRPGGPSPAETSTTRPHAAVASQYQRSSAQPSYRTNKPARALKREVLRIRYSSKTSQTAGCAGHFLGSVSLRSINGRPSPIPDASYKQGAPSSTFLTEADVVGTRDSPGSGARSPANGMDYFVDEAVAFGDDNSLNSATHRSSPDLPMQPPVPGGTEQPARPHRSRTSRPRIDASSIAAACGAAIVSSGAGHGSIAASIRSSRPPVASRQTVPIQYQSAQLPARLTCAGYLSIGGAPTRPHISKAQARAASIRRRLALTRKVFALMQEGKPMGEACSIVVKHAKMARMARKRRLQSMPDGGAAGSEQGSYQLQDTMASDGSSAGWGTVMAAYGAGSDAGARPARQGKEAAALSSSSLSLLRDEAIESCAGLSVLDAAVFEQDYRSIKQLLADCEREEKAETRRRNGQSPANEDDTVAKTEAAGLNKRVLSCLRSSREVHKQTRQAARSIRVDSRKHQKRIAGAKRKVMSNPQRLVEVAALRNAEARQEQERKEEAIKVMVRRMRMEAL